MFCEKCGTQLQPSEKFCPNCGAPAPVSAVPPVQGTSGGQQGGGQPDLHTMAQSAEKIAAAGVEGAKKMTAAGIEGAKNLTAAGIEGAKNLAQKGKDLAESAGAGKKFPKKALIGIGGAVVGVAVLGVVAAAAAPALRRTFSSPESYYRYVETQAGKELAENLGTVYGRMLERSKNLFNTSAEFSLSVEIGDAGQDLLSLAGLAGVDLSFLESVGVSGGVDLHENLLGAELAATLNKDKLISVRGLMDVAEGTAYAQVPELADTYLGAELEDYEEFADLWEDARDDVDSVLEALPSQAKIEKLITRYLSVALEAVEDVEKEKDTIKAEGVEQKVTALTVSLDADTVADMLDAVLAEAEDDEDLEDLIVNLAEAAGADGDDAFDGFLEELEYLQDDVAEYGEDIEMVVYVDGEGEIVGRELSVEEGDLIFLMPQKGKDFGFELSLEADRQSVSLVGSGKRSGDRIDGEFSLEYNGAALVEMTADGLDLAAMKQGLPNGKLTVGLGGGVNKVLGLAGMTDYGFAADFVKDIKVTLDMESSDNSQSLQVMAVEGKESIGGLKLTASLKGASSLNAPSEKSVVFVEDERDLEDWMEEIDWEKFVDHLSSTDLPRSITRPLEGMVEYLEDGDIEGLLYDYLYYYY